MANIDITDQGSTLNNGVLQLENGVAMDTTLRYVADQLNTKSQLLLATNATTVEGTLKIKTANVEYLDVEDIGGNNRFTISKAVGSQKVDLDFASNPTSPTDIVGGIRTFQNGVNLSDSLFFRKNGQATFTERVNVEGDSSVTTQTSSVIASTTTNANMVIAPNGTGALVANIPDGAVSGGIARGNYAVDLQLARGINYEVASGNFSFTAGYGNRATGLFSIAMGNRNTASGDNSTAIGGGGGGGQGVNAQANYSTAIGGLQNNAIGQYSGVFGGFVNTASSNYSTVSGGQSNTASTGTHATVVGGQSNTARGQYSVAGGIGNTAYDLGDVAFGQNNTASGTRSVAFGRSNTASGTKSFAHGEGANASATNAIAIGVTMNATGEYSTAIGFNNNSSGFASVALGYQSNSYLLSQHSISSQRFTSSGDAQQSLLTARKLDTLTTSATTVLSLDGTGTTNLIIPNGQNRMWNVQVRWVAVVTAITGTAAGVTVGDTKTSTDLLAVAKRAGSTTVSAHTSAGTHAIETVAGSLAAANIAYSAGASQEMAITFTGPTFAGGGSVTMRVVAAISLTEVAY